jgi:16S rRNA (cytosine967-C5)-methyltransferase
MLVSYVVSPKRGEVILDSCAAPGGKATHLAQLMQDTGRIIAIDIHPNRLSLIKENIERLGLNIIETVQADATKLDTVLKEQVDKVLIDAPCSGLGVLARRPDARWRKTPDQIEELAILQSELLNSAAPFIKNGGVLIYSVCTISHQEGIEVIEGFLRSHPEFVLDDVVSYLPASLRFEEPYKWVQLLPHKHGTDGLFMARLIKR